MLTLYRLLMTLALPVLLLAAWMRGDRLGERLGLVPRGRDDLWLAAASVGEVRSARWVVEALLAARPGLRVLVTVQTGTARGIVEGWARDRVTVALAPIDTVGAPGRVMDRRGIGALLLVEGELWPGRMAAARARGVPVQSIGARLSARSAARWARVPGLVRPMLARISFLSAQDASSRDRLLALGLRADATGPVLDLKAQLPPPAPTVLPGPAPRGQVLLAASTHAGEEAAVLDAFAAQDRFSHLILAPRHPDRGDEVARLMAARGMAVHRRSQGAAPAPGVPVFLADTMGEMDQWYAMAGACLIGGSLVDRGGHTPYEPGRHGTALLHGPSTQNFAEVFARLDAAGAALPVTADGLAATLQALSPERQADLARAAEPLLQPADGSDLVAALLARLQPGG